jgi:MoaA/NifB/PqqE/SkfB family radical SAM enzyme
MSIDYRQKLDDILSSLNADNGIVIFGAGRGGWYISRVLESFNIPVSYFVDNDSSKHGQYRGYPVVSPSDALSEFPDANILVGILNPKNLASVETQLSDLGYKNINTEIDTFLFSFFTQVVNREVDHDKYADSLELYFHKSPEDYTTLLILSYMIIEKCLLNCQDCGAFVPENADPDTYDVDVIVRDIEKFCQAFDFVHHIALQGGEPFLHPKLVEITERVGKISNLLFVDYVTNGTVVPNKEKLETIAKNGYTVLISDYGPDASTKVKKLTDSFDVHEIHFDYYLYEGTAWGKQFPIHPRERSRETNDDFYRKCISHKYMCMQIMDGQIHRCSFSNNASKLGFIDKFEEDFVSLNDGKSDAEISEKILKLAYRKHALEACDHCPSMEREHVLAGIQIERKQ